MTGKELYSIVSSYMENAVKNRRSPMRIISFATIGVDKSPKVRHVALRQFHNTTRSLGFHIDIRSPKTKELELNGRVEILAYHPKDKVQFRFQASAIIHYQNDISKTAWENSPPLSRKCYLTDYAPSTELPEGYDEAETILRKIHPPKEATEPGYHNFATIECVFDKVDFLKLNIKGHDRYKIWFEEDGTPRTMMISP